ncbi:HEPN/Toprim-associated domain-containing protein [Kribbella sp. NPDC023855]|uniref:HEPN/Toprim-associated domain-containing protein n=1 Tax=Kribbella sp. NPDC023855 TaxID=3154698 RepID=UPI0033EF2504
MAGDTYVEVGDYAMLYAQESYFPDVLALFTEVERAERPLADDDDWDSGFFGYTSSSGAVLDRLQAQGFTADRALAEFGTAVAAWHDHAPKLDPDVEELVPKIGVAELLRQLGTAVTDPNHWRTLPTFPEFEIVDEMPDPRFFLRVVLDLAGDRHLPVKYNLSRYFEGVERSTAHTDKVRSELLRDMPHSMPMIVLTEGTADARILAAGMTITHPHLVDFLRFMDFSTKAEGGVGALANLVKSLAAAGIPNHVVAIADNDTAAHEGLANLKSAALPANFRVLNYPELPLLKAYPTLGPQSDTPVLMDVNGRAGSLEMYLGEDLLTLGGQQAPIQWMGYSTKQKAYQGELVTGHKKRTQEAFQEKIRVANGPGGIPPGQDWSGITAIIGEILSAFD